MNSFTNSGKITTAFLYLHLDFCLLNYIKISFKLAECAFGYFHALTYLFNVFLPSHLSRQ